jgi:hypothetical protein
MSFDWGPHFIVPSADLKTLSGIVRLREECNENLLNKELDALGLSGSLMKISNPWYYRKKDTQTWIKIGESEDKQENFPVSWDTSNLENGEYEVLGLMHVFVKRENSEHIIARQSIVEVTIKN